MLLGLPPAHYFNHLDCNVAYFLKSVNRDVLCLGFIQCISHSVAVSSAQAIALLMLDVFTPKCRAISAPERPSSLLLRQAIAARTPLTLRRLLPRFSSFGLILLFLHSCRIISAILRPLCRSLSCLRYFSSASLSISCVLYLLNGEL